MHVLFVHQNFPAQFRCIAPRLSQDFRWTCTFVTRNGKAPEVPGVRRILYRPACGASAHTPFLARPFENALGHALGVYQAMKQHPDVQPDLVVAHSGFGSSMFMPFLYDAPIINFFEYLYSPVGQDLGYRPEFPVTEPMLLRSPCRNASILLDWLACARGWCPNEYQRDLFPPPLREKIEVIPEGVDTHLYRRRPDVKLSLPGGGALPAGTQVVTYVSRGFELMRGFDIFMQVAKRIYEQCPEAIFVVVGSDRVCYGGENALLAEKTFGQHVVRSARYDASRFCFSGHVTEETLAQILSVSDLHIYLTAPFVPSWSLLDAMSCGCVVLASDQACVREYIKHERNGLLCDFFDVEGIARQAVQVLKNPEDYRVLGTAARITVEEEYSLDLSLPRVKKLFETVAADKRSPSLIAERLIRPGTLGMTATGSDERRAAHGPRHSERSEESPAHHATDERSFTPFRMTNCRRPAQGNAAKIILLDWELGRGLGHMLPMVALAEGLVKRGYRVVVALRSLSRPAAQVFGRVGVSVRQAPVRVEGPTFFARTLSLAHILANIGWGDDAEFSMRAAGWRDLIGDVRPNLIVNDHSPTALLAAQWFPDVRTVVTGLGFFCPPDVSPFPPLIEHATAAEIEKLATDEKRILDRVNRLLAAWKRPPLERLAQLYGRATVTFLQTFAELDHYGEHRPAGTEYWGPVISGGGKAPQWPQSRTGKRVYAYLKRFPALPEVLKALADRGDATLVFSDGIDAATRQKFTCDTLRFEKERLDLGRVGAECDLAVHNANHGTLARLLLAGRPMLQLPLTLEQTVLARAVDRIGASETVSVKQPDVAADLAAKLAAMLDDNRYAQAAAGFAARHADFDPAGQIQAMVDRCTKLLGGKSPHVIPAVAPTLPVPARPAAVLTARSYNGKISVVTCSLDDARFERCHEMYRRLLGSHLEQVVRIKGATSIAAGYNSGVREARGHWVIFSHDDVEFLGDGFAERLRAHLYEFDVVGVAGTTRLVDARWTDAGVPYLYGQIATPKPNGRGYGVAIFGAPARAVGGMQAMDGVFLAVRRDVLEHLPFDEKRFDGFHLYDVDFTFSANLAGFRLGVANDLYPLHRSGGRYDKVWRGYAKRFLDKRGGQLARVKDGVRRWSYLEVETKADVVRVMTPGHWRIPDPAVWSEALVEGAAVPAEGVGA